jgi:nicotinate-nucleotide adenylyltransferase
MRASAIGVLGGIFDPLHNGHIALASLACDQLGLDTLYLVPAGVPPHKACSVRASAAHRLAMLRLATAGDKRLRVYGGEVRRGGISYTVDTLRELRRLHPASSILFVIGSDNLAEIPSWRCYREILSMVTLCVAHRPGHPLRRPPALVRAAVRTLCGPEWGVSSTMVRDYLARGCTCRGLVPEPVRRYIARHGLYRLSTSAHTHRATAGRRPHRHS